MALTGGTLGKVSVVDTNRTLLQNYRVGNFLPNSELNKSFLYQILTSFYLKNAVKKLVNEAAQPNFGKQDFDKLFVPIPPTLTEQKAIATALSDVDELISGLEQLITKKKAIKQGAMQQLLTPPHKDWSTKTIKEVAIYRRGSFPQPYGLAKWYDDISGMPFVQVVDVDKNKKLKAETKQKISEEGAKMSVFVKKGTIILTIQGSIGRICITQYDSYVDRTLLIFESFKENFNTYFFMITVWLKFQIEKENAPGGIIKTITKEALSSFEISFPNRKEQNRIAEILENIDKELQELESKKAKYQAIKQGMMQELLTGKTRLV
jgi:type I restriction enzyme S subunit